ncbi:hypothetical protein SAY87_010113 [Trapa incisa]|uniref:Uncharacterized protein n=1 Tax=Trapa incisa TaxID=236973 RepID=A0AAN7GE48_9MYRT|nr:hypothetical protein SAY87_010113 [Trapa incisa]
MALQAYSSLNLVCPMTVLVVLLFASIFSSLGLLSAALTVSMVLLSSTLLLSLSKQKSSEGLQVKEASAHRGEDSEAEEDDPNGEVDDSLAIRSCESMIFERMRIDSSSTSNDSEVDWPLDRTHDCSDGTISDEESLIEIAIPSGHYIVDHKEDNQLHKFYKKMPDLSPDSIFHGSSLISLLGEINDINEEENLIEIDILAGSVKCSRFGIKG